MTQHRSYGFTLVELMLSMAFISMLLLGIAMLVLQVTSTYNKGLTLRDVNQAGQLLSTDIQRSLSRVSPEAVTSAPEDDADATGGRFCVGNTVYAWNYGAAISADQDLFNIYQGATDEPIRLVKFQQDAADYCVADPDGKYESIPATASELLTSGDKDLAVHLFNIDSQPVAGDDAQKLYAVRLRIGTSEQAIVDGGGCEVPKSRIDDEYCAVNNFDFTARAGAKEVMNNE